ncbi:MAG: hypothetical protein ACP5SH_19285 [Syntrophobacteraceae bacterium]
MNQQFRMARQMIDMQKASVEITLNNLIATWDQTAALSKGTPWLPEQGRKALMEWVELNRKACEGLKSALASGYSSLQQFFPS